ncbi:CDP-alcohol phosphatidyltransferase family protein [Modicisalibacter coralii]|uniref:CDP-alcohol phosphatidyltransferase family protein n=1 Tax=Modicisalibacter coralii TaxID=2304602 RepID=UPI00100AEF36|nr:CDP-alcohol phosphatidyltransferase family protein [Halomonas coralii]
MRRSSPPPAGVPRLRRLPLPSLAESLAVLTLFALLVESLLAWLAAPAGLRVSAGAIYLAMLVLVAWGWAPSRQALGWANRVTLLRGMPVAVIAGALVFPEFMARHAGAMAGLALVALLLDGVDGWVARLTRSISRFGARFDMELDAFFIVVLCAALTVLGKVGCWVLAIGALRYLFVMAGWRWQWLQRPLFASRRRKVICVWQVATLLVGLLPWTPESLASGLAGVALALLGLSFAIDVRWLARRRHVPVPAGEC